MGRSIKARGKPTTPTVMESPTTRLNEAPLAITYSYRGDGRPAHDTDANARHIAAANPHTMLWLLEMLQDLRHLGNGSYQIAATWKAYQEGPPTRKDSHD